MTSLAPLNLPTLLESLIIDRTAPEVYELLRRLFCLSASGIANRAAVVEIVEDTASRERATPFRPSAYIRGLRNAGYLDVDLCPCLRLPADQRRIRQIVDAMVSPEGALPFDPPVAGVAELSPLITHDACLTITPRHDPPAPSSDPGLQIALGCSPHEVIAYGIMVLKESRPSEIFPELTPAKSLRELAFRLEATYHELWVPGAWQGTNPDRIRLERPAYEERRARVAAHFSRSFAPLFRALDQPFVPPGEQGLVQTYQKFFRWSVGEVSLQDFLPADDGNIITTLGLRARSHLHAKFGRAYRFGTWDSEQAR